MITVGVVSDTHFPRFGRALPRSLDRGLRTAGVERIVHCGDMTDLLAIDLLERIAPVDAVAGNNDGPEIRARFGRKTIVRVEDVRIGIVHGDRGKRGTVQNAYDAFADDDVQVICFGHSHIPLIEERGGRLLVNPGSPSDKRMNLRYSYALLTIDGARVDAGLHFYLDRSAA
jgi:putative phosphoesterase